MSDKKDWSGNKNSVYKTLGASNHTDKDRQNEDYYATDPVAAEWLLKLVRLSNSIWEPACGEGHLSKVLEQKHKVVSTDLINRGYGEGGIDFLAIDNLSFEGDIVTNPPYKYAQEFVEKALHIIPDGNKVCMFLKLQFMEGKARKQLFLSNPPHTIYVSSSRLLCAKNGDFKNTDGSAVAYAWFVWVKGFKGNTTIEWFN
jgi:hypothetical protein